MKNSRIWVLVAYVATLLALSALMFSSDVLHIPLLVKHHQESHAVAGAVVGLGMDWYLHEVTPMNRPWRYVTSVATALAIGTFKEHLVDHHPRNKEIGPWGLGAAAALTISYTVRF